MLHSADFGSNLWVWTDNKGRNWETMAYILCIVSMGVKHYLNSNSAPMKWIVYLIINTFLKWIIKFTFGEQLPCVKHCNTSLTYIIVFHLHDCLIFRGLDELSNLSTVGPKIRSLMNCIFSSPSWYFLTWRILKIYIIQTESYNIVKPMCIKLYSI